MNIDDYNSIELSVMIEHFKMEQAAIFTLMNAVAYLVSIHREESPDKIYNDMKATFHTIYTTLNKEYPSGLRILPEDDKRGASWTFPLSPDDLFPPYTKN
jgi:hypothetical protein